MNKLKYIFSLIILVFALIKVILTFMESSNPTYYEIEINIWICRIVWISIALGLFNSFYDKVKHKRNESKN